jgi:ligand-binding SRPBCC domain-containing protein
VIEQETRLARPAAEVWARATTPAGVNAELGPWMRMTVPRPWRDASLADIRPGTTIGRSWVLLLGVLPIDYDDLGIAEVREGYFKERSAMASALTWQHERWVNDDRRGSGPGCVVRDRVEYVPRRWVAALPGATRAHRAIITATFRHRHRRLAAW